MTGKALVWSPSPVLTRKFLLGWLEQSLIRWMDSAHSIESCQELFLQI